MTTPVDHPPWCIPDRCGVSAGRPDGTHCSRLVVLGPYPPGPVVVEVQVAQGPAISGYPLVGPSVRGACPA
jgi:hypothetical protein